MNTIASLAQVFFGPRDLMEPPDRSLRFTSCLIGRLEALEATEKAHNEATELALRLLLVGQPSYKYGRALIDVLAGYASGETAALKVIG